MERDTIRVTGTGCVLIGPEGRTPPLPFITMDADEADALIAQKLATAYTGTDADTDADAEAEEARITAEREAADAAEAERIAAAEADAERLSAEAAALAAAEAERTASEGKSDETDASEGEGGNAEADERAGTIAEALALVEADGLVKTGDRAGKPKVSAIEDITGLTDVTADEIDAVIAAQESAD